MEPIDLASVVSVAHNRMTSLRQVGPDLMFAPAFQASFYKRGLPEAPQYTNMGNSQFRLCSIFGGISPVSCVLGQIRFNPAQVLGHASLYHGHDERIPLDGFRWGVAVLCSVVERFCVPE